MLVYPSYQYFTTRQDGSSGGGFIETVQNFFFQNLGSGQGDNGNQIMDAVESDKPQFQPQSQSQPPTPPLDPEVENKLHILEQQLPGQKSALNSNVVGVSEKSANPTLNESKQKFVYSYVTPASTVPLNADRRLFFLAEQPQPLFGSFSGSAINPVFNLQPVPVVLSRSNVAQPDEPQPNKVISENVQKFSQIPPVMAAVEPAVQVQSKSNENSQSESVVVDAVSESRVAPQPPVQVVEDNRALPIVSTEATVVPDVSAVVVARSNAVPLSVSSEPVSPVVAPVIGNVASSVVSNVEGNESVQQAVVSPSLKADVPSAVVSAVVSDPVGVPSAVVEQNVQSSQSAVESVVGSV